MFDSKFLRENLDQIAFALSKRGFTLEQSVFLEMEGRRKGLQVETQDLQAQRNSLSKKIGQFKSKGEDASEVLAQVAGLGEQLKANEAQLATVLEEIKVFELNLPNIPHESVPEGRNEEENEVVRTWGEAPRFDFEVKDHVALGEDLKLLDFAAAAKLSGSRFSVLSGQLARLQRALGQFMLDVHTAEHGYEEQAVPFLVSEESMICTGQLPKFRDDQYMIPEENGNLCLIPTGEVPLTNLARDMIFDAAELPKKYTGLTSCFRRESGSYGKDTRGLIRLHQFEKVELVQVCHPDNSYEALEALTGHAEVILQRLELPYRVVNLCAGDLGVNSAKTYDLEVWLPAQDAYREISSCSNFESFQAQRLSARWRPNQGDKPELVHTLNGSGLAVGRTLAAVMENYQKADGSIAVPPALKPYMNGIDVIG